MIILAIETSCDETAAAVVKDGHEILSNIIASSVELHAKTGGIIPEFAAREQIKSIIPIINEALNKSRVTSRELDTIAVTVGPGLIGSLLVGIETAKTLSWVWNKPLIPVNHLVGHIYANWLIPPSIPNSSNLPNPPHLPAIALVVSGGHTDLVLIKNHGNLEYLGGTRDDAAGEAFDKTARLLDLGFPGGPAISKAATSYQSPVTSHGIKLPRPLLNNKSFDFSFSGLKTAILREVNRLKTMEQWSNETISHLAHETQESITDVLVTKTLRAVEHYKVNTLLVAGGVAANSRLKEKFQTTIEQLNNVTIDLHIPPPHLCTDNAAMIASAAYFNHKPTKWKKVTTHPSLTIVG